MDNHVNIAEGVVLCCLVSLQVWSSDLREGEMQFKAEAVSEEMHSNISKGMNFQGMNNSCNRNSYFQIRIYRGSNLIKKSKTYFQPQL